MTGQPQNVDEFSDPLTFANTDMHFNYVTISINIYFSTLLNISINTKSFEACWEKKCYGNMSVKITVCVYYHQSDLTTIKNKFQLHCKTHIFIVRRF